MEVIQSNLDKLELELKRIKTYYNTVIKVYQSDGQLDFIEKFHLDSIEVLMLKIEKCIQVAKQREQSLAEDARPQPIQIKKGKVTASLLNVRKGPSTDYSKVRLLKKGEEVELHEMDSNWYRIDTNQWVSAKYIATKETIATGNQTPITDQECVASSNTNESASTVSQDTQTNPQIDPVQEGTQVLPSSTCITDSVGKRGVNLPSDVRVVQQLLAERWNYDQNITGVIDDKTIHSIKQFQYDHAGFISRQDGKIDVNGTTWQFLIGQRTATVTDRSDGVLGGAETERELKMAEFVKAFSGIEIELQNGETIRVRPPYHINLGDRKENALAARRANPSVNRIVQGLGFGGSVGKATPSQIESFLEQCIQKNLIRDTSSKGLYDFLAKYGISTDCSGLAVQAANFLEQGDMDRAADGSGEVHGIQNTASIQRKQQVGSPAQLQAGDMMVNYKREGTSVYHVRIIIDVDVAEDGLYFTTVESGASTDLGVGGNGIGQRRWKFTNASSFDDLHILKGNDWHRASRNDQAYIYTRF